VGKVSDGNDVNWERKVLEKLALEALAEQKRGRRWGIFFKLLGFGYLALLLVVALDLGKGEHVADGTKYTALVDLSGVIKAKGDANAEHVTSALQAAFEDKHTAGVILRINSPGGSPVQSGIINDEMRRLRAKYPAIPLHVVVEDVCASGGYYVAAAADKIFVDKASIVGSIGVLMDGFGFTGAMDKLGVERRLLTAGEKQGFPRSLLAAEREP
jgi:protease-4